MYIIVSLIVIQLLVFVGLAFLLRNMMTSVSAAESKRLAKIADEHARIEQKLAAKMEEAESLRESTISETEKKARAMLARAERDAAESANEMREKARTQADEIIAQAMKVKDQLRAEIENELRPKCITLSCQMLRMLLRSDHHQSVHEGIVNETLGEIEEMDKDRWHIMSSADSAEVKCPYPLKPEQKERLKKLLSAKAGREIALKESVDKDIGVGIVIRLGSLIIDGGLEGRLNDIAERIDENWV